MNNQNESDDSYITIGELTKKLGLIDKKTGRPQTHTIRYWETQFKQIKPSIKAGGRRYYSKKIFMVIKHIKFLLRERGLTIDGARKVLNGVNSDYIDPNENIGINIPDLKRRKIIKNKIKNISKIVRELKKIK